MDWEKIKQAAADHFAMDATTPIIDRGATWETLPARNKPSSSAENLSGLEPMTSPECRICGDFGWLVGDKKTPLVECSCGKIARQRQERELRNRMERAAKSLTELHARLGRLRTCTFENFNPARPLAGKVEGKDIAEKVQRQKLTEALRLAREYVANPQGWLYLYGPVGAGKSHLAAAIANALAVAGWPTAYESTPELLDFVRRGFKDNSSAERVDALINVELLVLDDLGAESLTDWSLETMFRIIDGRNKHERPTVLTSNVHYDSLPFRVSSRIAELSTVVWMPISDCRRLRGAA